MSDIQIIFSKNARDDIRKLDKQVAKRVHKKLVALLATGRPLDSAVRLTKPTDAQYRWRIGDYRLLFDFDPKDRLIIILKIQHRRQVYR